MQHRLYGSPLHGVTIGLLATGAGLAAAELVAGLHRGAASPVLPVGQVVIDHVPASVKDWAIDTFGTADKAVLVLGTLFSLAVIGSIVGILAVHRRFAAAFTITGLIGLVGVWAVLVRPAPDLGKLLPPIVGTLVSIAVLWYLAPADDEGAADDPARRGFVQGAATVGALALVATFVGRALRGRFAIEEERAELEIPEPANVLASPAGTDFGIEQVTPWVVPNDRFYRIDTALSVPQVPRRDWRLRVHGMVARELELTFDDIVRRPMIERYITLSCVSNQVGGDLVGNALFQGVRLKDVLDEAGVDPEATQVVSRSIDGWNCGSPTSAIMDGRDALLAIAMNGEPLPAEHGYPVRIVVPGLYGYVSATKWVTEIELTRWEDFDAYWVPRGWSKEGPVKTMARIDRPRHVKQYTPDADGAVVIAGLAWAVHRGISKVEVSIDEGEWVECELGAVPSDDTWRQWRFAWLGASEGRHSVRARAFDAAGMVQPEEPKSPAPDGAQGYHRVAFDVTR